MIEQFNDGYEWLSNFYPCSVIFRGKQYAAVEYAYMSAKSDDAAWKKRCLEATDRPGKIKKMSRQLELVENWEAIRLEVMRECLVSKFSQEPYRTWLLETGDAFIREGNNWGDTFWGVDQDTGEGENHLGKLIMEIREALRKG